MDVDISNLTPTFLAFWQQARSAPPDEQRRLWQHLYEAPYQAIFDVYYQRWGSRDRLPTALQRFPQVAPKLAAAAARVEQSIDHIGPRLTDVFADWAGSPPFVVMVGLFGSNGWATHLQDQPTCFVGLEEMVDLPEVDVLIAHEAAHAVHARHCAIPMITTAIDEALFLEGLATLASALVLPGRPVLAYLWFSNAHTTQGQPVEAWLSECKQCWPDVRQQLLRDLQRSDERTMAAYFWAKPALLRPGVPVRIAYWVGYRLLREMHATYPFADIARWTRDRAVSEVRQALEQMVTLDC